MFLNLLKIFLIIIILLFVFLGHLLLGNFADLVLFNPAIIQDKATITQPQELSEGILQVWVNGISVYKDGKSTHQYPGMVITRN